MATDARKRLDVEADCSRAREARRKVVEKLTELILAEADAVEAQQQEGFSDRLAALSFLHEQEADPAVLRRFVESPIYRWLSSEYVAGDSREHPLCRALDILGDLAPGAFGRFGRSARDS